MTNGTNFFHLVCLLAVMLTMAQPHSLTYAQAPVKPTTIKGVVVDSLTREPIPFAMVLLQGSSAGTQADADGRFDITTKVNFLCANFSMMGYAPKDIYVSKGEVNDLTVELSADGVALKEFVVRPGKEHYSRKNNPAVQFMEKLRDMKEKYDPRNHDYYSYDKYEKMNFALNDFSEKNKDKWLFKKFKFIFEYMDTSEVSGKPILNVSVKEKLSTAYFRRSPHAEKEFVKGIKRAGVDEIFDEESVQRFLEDVFKEVDIFDNDIAIMQNRFVSPLSKIGSGFYKYYLSDTIPVDGIKCIELSFAPFNNRTFGFFGRIYVPLGDSTMFVKKVVMNVPRDINLNYVNNLRIEQTFDKAPDGCRIKTKDDMTVEFSIIPSSQGLYARRRTLYENFSFDKPENDGIFNEEAKLIEATDARQMPDEYWKENRMTPIKEKENAIDKLLTQLRSVPAFYWTEKTISVLVSGYIPTGDKNTSKFDFGPMNTTISGNTVEGARLKVGGMTTANLSKHWFMKGYTAYGFRDKKWKYDGEVEYSFNEKKYHAKEFPIHSLRLHHKYDINQLGQQYMFTNMDNVFLAWKRQTNDKVTYLRTSELEYKRESENGLAVTVGLKHQIQEATRWMPFVDGYGNWSDKYQQSSVNLTLRYAPGEKFYDARFTRIPINLDMPILILSHTYSPKGVLGNKFTINKTELSVQKRFWFSAFGYTDIILKGGKVWSKVSYPDLLLPNANLSYTIQPESYALMNAMEFMNDQYLSWDITYWINGALLNRVPLIKYLKLREVVSFKGLYGSLSDKNNPEKSLDIYRFPINALCRPMEKTPYMEMSVGLDNILTILRVDYVWRLTYRDTPGVDKSGWRIALHFTF